MDWRNRALELIEQHGNKWQMIAEKITQELGEQIKPERVRRFMRDGGRQKGKPETAVLHLTDIHEGKNTASFSPDVLEERLLKMAKRVVLIAKILKKTYSIDKLVILITGDCIDNDSIYPNQQAHTDAKAKAGRQQVNRLMETMAKVIEVLQKEFIHVDIECVYGNHGRVSKQTDEKNNWDLMFYDMLATYYRDDKYIKVNTADRFYKVVDIQGHGFLLYHGHAIRMSHGIPWYGMTKRIGNWKANLDDKFRYAMVGHFHTIGMTPYAGVDIYMGGTAVTDDDWALEGLGTKSDQRYWFLGVHPEQGITWEYKINLT